MRELGLIALAALLLGFPLAAQEDRASVHYLQVDGAIGPATTHYLTRGFERAAEADAPAVVIRLDTPGGLDAATRDINKAILASPVPVIIWVSPEGARAASAGTYMLYASHLAAMAPATNLGAATPIQIGGGMPAPREEPAREDDDEDGDDEDGAKEPAPGTAAAERKAINDAAAYIRGLAELRGRNAEWAERAVREAVSLTSEEALEQNVIDFVAASLDGLLRAADGRTVKTHHGEVTLDTAGRMVERIDPDWRSELLSVITNPTVAYLLMMLGLYGLVLEGYNPGALVPGVVGAICLLLALFAFQVLPVNYAGLALIVLGFALILAELFVPSFGILGIGGVVAVIFGSIILMDTDMPGYVIPTGFLVGVGATAGLLFFGVMYLVVRSQRRGRVSGVDTLIGRPAEVIEDFVGGRGRVHVEGEDWSARSGDSLRHGDSVRIKAVDGLVLEVEATGERQ